MSSPVHGGGIPGWSEVLHLSLLSAGVRGEHHVRRSPILCMFSAFEVQLYFSMHLV